MRDHDEIPPLFPIYTAFQLIGLGLKLAAKPKGDGQCFVGRAYNFVATKVADTLAPHRKLSYTPSSCWDKGGENCNTRWHIDVNHCGTRKPFMWDVLRSYWSPQEPFGYSYNARVANRHPKLRPNATDHRLEIRFVIALRLLQWLIV